MRWSWSIPIVALHATCFADPTVGLMVHDQDVTSEGYTFFSPMSSLYSYIIDTNGEMVHSWEHETIPGNASYLLPSGDILRTGNNGSGPISGGGQGGIVTQQTWDGDEAWSYELNNAQFRMHHDIAPMPNGNVLVIAWEYKSQSQAVEAGRIPSSMSQGKLWPETIIEINPNAKGGPQIVWQWHVWDHLVQNYDPSKDNYVADISNFPERININFYNSSIADWLHINAIDYNAQLDQILLSCPKFKEVWIIDHSTTSEEATTSEGGTSGMGGDLLYRWGNPRAWENGTTADQKLFAQHGVNWIDDGLDNAGDILLFNNGVGRVGDDYSTIESFEPPLSTLDTNYNMNKDGTWGPESATLLYEAPTPTDFYAEFLSGAQRLPNGNTLICYGPHGRLFEVDETMAVVWDYINPVVTDGVLCRCESIPGAGSPIQDNASFRVLRYALAYAAFDGRDLTPMGPIEYYYGDYNCDSLVNTSDILEVIAGWGNPYGIYEILSIIKYWGGSGCP